MLLKEINIMLLFHIGRKVAPRRCFNFAEDHSAVNADTLGLCNGRLTSYAIK